MKFPLSDSIYRLWTRYGIYGVLLLSFMISFFHLGARTLHGDEPGSIVDAGDLSRNPHALMYFILLRVWLIGGTSEFWLRALSALSVVVATAVVFAATSRLCNQGVALAAAALFATAPFAEVYAQQVRFYSIFLLAACLSVWAFANYLTRPTRRGLIILGLADLVLLTSHAMAILLVLGQVITLFLIWDKFSLKPKLFALGLLTAIIALLVLIPEVRVFGFNSLARYMNDPSQYSISRGLSLAQIGKIPLTIFFFFFGESVYPLSYGLAVPGVLVYGLVSLWGLWKLRSRPVVLIFCCVTISITLTLLYLVFDALIPGTIAGASPRYIIFLLPLIYVVLAAGVQGKSARWLVTPLLLVNLASLGAYWYGDWAYTDDLVNWREVTQWVDNYVTPQTGIVMDGRSQTLAKPYFPNNWNQRNVWDYSQSSGLRDLTEFQRIVFLSFDFREDRRILNAALLQKIEEKFDQSASLSRYPLFVYVYDQKAGRAGRFRIDDATRAVILPVEVYGLEFQDIRLPITVNLQGKPVQISGAFGLPGINRESIRTLRLEKAIPVCKIWLLSTITNASRLDAGTTIATLTLNGEGGSSQTIPLRQGFETNAWNRHCQTPTCQSVYTWRKRFALLGAEGYPESWQEFDASIFAGELILSEPTMIHTLEFQRVPSPGMLYIWGIVLEP
jgi:hypothetical protein